MFSPRKREPLLRNEAHARPSRVVTRLFPTCEVYSRSPRSCRWPSGSIWLNCSEAALKGTKITVAPEGRRQPPGQYGHFGRDAILANNPGVNGLYGVTPAPVQAVASASRTASVHIVSDVSDGDLWS